MALTPALFKQWAIDHLTKTITLTMTTLFNASDFDFVFMAVQNGQPPKQEEDIPLASVITNMENKGRLSDFIDKMSFVFEMAAGNPSEKTHFKQTSIH